MDWGDECSIDKGIPVKRARPNEPPRIFPDLITLHIDDLTEVGKAIRRSKGAVMEALKVSLGRVKIQDLTRERLIEFGKKRANTAQVYRRYQSIFPSSARKSGSGEILSRRSSTKRRSRILRACWSKQEFWNSNLKSPGSKE
jgi:hypothetical protein